MLSCTCIICTLFRIDFVATDDKEKFVMEVHVRAGDDDEIYVDRENKVRKVTCMH